MESTFNCPSVYNSALYPLRFLKSLIRPKVKTQSTCSLTTHLASVIAARCEKRESEGRSSVKLWRADDGKSKDLISASTFNVSFLSMTFKLLMVGIVHLLNNLTLPFIQSGTGFVAPDNVEKPTVLGLMLEQEEDHLSLSLRPCLANKTPDGDTD